MKNKIILFLVLCFCINFAGIAQSTVHESVKFQSKKLGKEVSYSIYLPDGYATVSISLEVRDKNELAAVSNKLGQIQGVYQVRRASG